MRTPSPHERWFLAAALAAIASTSCTAAEPPPARVPPRAADSGGPAPVVNVAPEPEPGASAGPAAPQAPGKRAALRFDVEGDDFPSPLVDVIVSGQPTTMLVDTGATHQVVGRWVAEQIGPVTQDANDVGIDHAGKALPIARLEGAQIVVSGWGPIDASEAVVVAIPGPLERRGIGGVLSPQALAAEGRAVVLDFRRGTMTEAAWGDAMRGLDAEAGAAAYGEVKSCGPGGGALAYVQVAIGGTEVLAQLDTGATQTTVRAASAAGAALAKRAKGASSAIAASGTYTVATAEGTRVALGELAMDVDVALVPKAARTGCTNDAQIGMDVLRRCVIVLGPSAVATKCSPPPR